MNIRWISLAACWLAAMALYAGVGLFVPARAQEIVIGQVAPLSGVLASTGAQMVLGGKIYFDWVNAQGGVHGATIRQAVVDDGYQVTDTVRLTRELLARPEVVALYGFAGTANITQLLADGVLAQGGAARWHPIPVVNRCASRSTPGSSTCAQATPTRPSTWCSSSPRWA